MTVPTQKTIAHYALNSKFRRWNSTSDPPQYLFSDLGIEYLNSEMANCCTLFHFRLSPKLSYALWTNGLVEVPTKDFGKHLRMFLLDTPESWFIRVHFFEYAHITQPLSHLHVSPYEMVFHTQPHLPLNFQLSLSGNQFRECTAIYCSELPFQSHFQSIHLYPLFHSFLLKPISTRFLAVETAMLQIFCQSISIRTLKQILLQKCCEKRPILKKPYHWIHLCYTGSSKLFKFRRSWNLFIKVLSKLLTSLQK